jgi:TolB-like protein/Flp pilus assembly protein TadD
MSQTGPSPGSEARASERLDSWKEIAVHLRRDIRTVQRWEKSEAMPVHRHQHDKLGSVFAFKSELDEWQRGRSPAAGNGDGVPPAGESEAVSADDPAQATERPAPPPIAPPLEHDWRWWMLRLAAMLVGAALIYGIVNRGQALFRRTVGSATITVLPFKNLSGDPRQEYFSEGVTEEVITYLGRESTTLRVTSLGSSLAYKDTQKTARQIGRELGVEYVVQGSVLQSGGRVRINAHLIRAGDEAHLWDESFERETSDILALQSEVAEAIVEGISVRLRPRRTPTRALKPEAYEAYLMGRYFWNKRTPEALNRAITYFQQTTQLAPDYAPAYAGIADCYVLLGSAQMGALAPRTAMPAAKEAVLKALALDPDLAEAHASLAHIKLIYDWDWAGAEQEFRRAIELNPAYPTAHQWYALLLNATGRSSEALAELDKAQSMDPLSPAIKAAIAEAYYLARRYDESIAASQKVLELDPNSVLGLLGLGRAQEQKGDYDAAIATFTRGWELSGRAPIMTMFLGHAYALRGDRARAGQLLKSLTDAASQPGQPQYVSSLYVASIYTGLGQLDQAFAALEKAADERCEYLIYLDREPMADVLRQDPRFPQYLASHGLKPPAR